MAQKFYVLAGERGEYLDRAEEVYGVFESLAAAEAAAAKLPELSAQGWEAYRSFEARCRQIATVEGFPSVEGEYLKMTEDERQNYHLHNAKVREIKTRIGPSPEFFCVPETFWITEFCVGEIGTGIEIFRSDETTTS